MKERFQKLKEHFRHLRPAVIRPASGFLRYDYTVPGGYYQELWDWDGFFISVHLAGRSDVGAAYLKNWAMNFVAAADENGRAPGCLTPKGPEKGHRFFQMKPLMAQGVELASRLLDDVDWAAENYDTVRKIATIRESTHFDEKYGLFAWDSAMQSGADNNPALSNDPEDYGVFLTCDVNALQWREYLALARMAGRSIIRVASFAQVGSSTRIASVPATGTGSVLYVASIFASMTSRLVSSDMVVVLRLFALLDGA